LRFLVTSRDRVLALVAKSDAPTLSDTHFMPGLEHIDK
jgi:hypothetical protein